MIYLQPNDSTSSEDSFNMNYKEYVLQKDDIINLEVRSIDPSITQIFNQSGSVAPQIGANGGDLNYLTGFQINNNGDIELPLIGFIQIAGKTLQEAKIALDIEIGKYINNPYIVVRLGGIRFSAFGEFRRPGRYSILQSRATIFEAIATAGDLTEIANRSEILIVRQDNGKINTYNIDLTDRNLLESDFYFIQPNDQIYIEPLAVRQIGGGVGVTGLQTFTTALSVLSSVLLVIISLNRI